MHFEILVEDRSGKMLIDKLMEKLINGCSSGITYRTIAYSGIGKLPKNLDKASDPSKRVLLNKLPQLLRGYGKSLTDDSALIIVVDCDKRNCADFKQELINALNSSCILQPKTAFCIAIEEMEAWLLGDMEALLKAYPSARKNVLEAYVQDSQNGTWEQLADAIYSQKAHGLKKRGYPDIGVVKCEWADRISSYMRIDNNISPSFRYFIRKINTFIMTT